jgi:hypothetical protein
LYSPASILALTSATLSGLTSGHFLRGLEHVHLQPRFVGDGYAVGAAFLIGDRLLVFLALLFELFQALGLVSAEWFDAVYRHVELLPVYPAAQAVCRLVEGVSLEHCLVDPGQARLPRVAHESILFPVGQFRTP